MSVPVPGIVERTVDQEVIELPISFYATLMSNNTILHKGQILEVFFSLEGPEVRPTAGDEVRCIFVRQSQQIYVIEKKV